MDTCKVHDIYYLHCYSGILLIRGYIVKRSIDLPNYPPHPVRRAQQIHVRNARIRSNHNEGKPI